MKNNNKKSKTVQYNKKTKQKQVSKHSGLNKKSKKLSRYQKVQSGGKEVTKEMKTKLNSILNVGKPDLSILPTEMSEEEYKLYKQMQNNELAEAESYRDPFVHEYMFSPLLSEQMKSEKNAIAGSYLVGVNPLKFYDQVKKIVQGKRNNSDMNNTLQSLGNWVDRNKQYDLTQIKDMGYRNDSGIVLKVEDVLTRDSSFKDIVTESKKYSSISKQGKITARGLIKMVRLLDKFKKEESQWLRVATAIEIIFENLGLKNSREKFFKSERIIPEYVLFEIEEFFNTNHIFMTRDEIRDFKNKLSFYRITNEKLGMKVKRIGETLEI
jgi:hypothetical protein